MVPRTRSTQPLVFGLPAWMNFCRAPGAETVRPNWRARNSEPLSVITFYSRQPARTGPGSPPGRPRGPFRRRIARGCKQLGPDVGGDNVDGGVLPQRPSGAGESADMEAVRPRQLAGMVGLQVVPGFGIGTLRSRRGGVAGHRRGGTWTRCSGRGAAAPARCPEAAPLSRPTWGAPVRRPPGPVPGTDCRCRTPGCAAPTAWRSGSASAAGAVPGAAGSHGRSGRPFPSSGRMRSDGPPSPGRRPGRCRFRAPAPRCGGGCVFGGHGRSPLLRVATQQDALSGPYEFKDSPVAGTRKWDSLARGGATEVMGMIDHSPA